jgi:hypothetical protein
MRIKGLTLLMYGLLIIIGQANAAEVAVIPSTQIITPGSTFTMDVSIDPQGTAIAGAQINIAFNNSLIRVNSITEGNLFKQSGANTFFNSGIINNSAGTIINIFNAIIGRNNVSTQGTFIIINATAIGTSGTSGINISNVKLSDPIGNPVALIVTNGSVMLNSPPLLTSIGTKTINEGQMLAFTLSATDANGDAMVFSATGLPAGASFNLTTHTFQWMPNYTQSGNYSTRFAVTDGIYTVQENIIITVNNVNLVPIFTSIPANGSIFNETEQIQITVTASDPDSDPVSYVIKIDGIQVSTLSKYNWTTNYSNAGYHNIFISVSDGIATVNSTIIIYINNAYPRYDVDENGIVDIRDMVIIGQNFNKIVSAPYPRYDVNMDGVVDIADITITAQYFGENT